MTITSALALILFLLHLAGPGSPLCAAARAEVGRSAPQPVSLLTPGQPRDAALAGDATIVLQSEDLQRRLVRLTLRGEETLQSMNVRRALGQDALVVNGEHWWYASGGEQTTFIVDGAASNVPFAGRAPYLFLPLRGEQPRGLQFSATNPQTTLVREVDEGNARRSWQVPRIDLLNAHVIAQRLADDRIALFAARNGHLELMILGEQPVVPIPLRDSAPFQFASAVDGAGHLALVTATATPGGQSIESATIDPDHPDAATWHLLTKNARVASWPTREMQVIATHDGFVAAWVDRSATRRFVLQACELRNDGSPPAIAGLGDPTEGREFGAFFAMQASGDDLLFFWDDGRRLVMRRVPDAITQFAAAERLAKVCTGG